MRDGVRIAVDVYLPLGVGPSEKLPAIIHQTRYFRGFDFRWPFSAFVGDPFNDPIRSRFVTHGYAWIDVDVRGTGASEGTWLSPYSPDEIKDGAEIVGWIVRQPWSNGKVGSTGISYDGSAADMLLVNRHPAVKAIASRFSSFDVYPDIAFPGGIRHTWFLDTWSALNRALDKNAFQDFLGWYVALALRGVRPVPPDSGVPAERLRARAANMDVAVLGRTVEFRDDRSAHSAFPTETIDLFSAHRYLAEIRASGAAIYAYSGWFDGAYPHAAITRFLAVEHPRRRLILGPWDHGGLQNVSPAAHVTEAQFDHPSELVRFFDAQLGGTFAADTDEPPVAYFTMGEERWKFAATWPPPGLEPRTFYLGEGHALVPSPAPAEGDDSYRVDHGAGTGSGSRWNTLINPRQVRIGYPDRTAADRRLLVYDSAPLEESLEVTGHPVVTLFASSTATDGQYFVYLEDVAPSGDVVYLTEGLLRAIHRRLSPEPPPYPVLVPYRTFRRADAIPMVPGEVAELSFHLIPTSYLFRRGHAMRVAIAGADVDHFEPLPGLPALWRIHRGGAHASRIVLPSRSRPDRP